MINVIFTFDGFKTIIKCLKEDKMKNICLKYASKIHIDINSIYFLYAGNKVNFDLTYEQQANIIDKNKNEMNILVYKYEKEKFVCPKCGESIKLDTKLIDNICLSINDINDNLIGIKGQIENIINDILNQKKIGYISNQLKNINIIISNIIGEIKKNNKKLNKLNITNQNNDIINNTKYSIIEGILDININDINNEVILFNRNNKDGIDVYLNCNKINMTNEKNKWKIDYNFKKDGKYNFKIIFNNKIKSLKGFFQNCSNLYSIDLSNFDNTDITDISYMFNLCHKLKEIKGLNKFNSSNINNIAAMFHCCYELEYLDLSNFETESVIDMSHMFNKCHKLKEIKGLNLFKTNKVINMSSMFQECKNLEYLDLSYFNTSNVFDMSSMFNQCHKLKEIKGINKFKTKKVTNMCSMFQECEELELLDLSNFDTSNVFDMSYMFNNCYKLKEIKGINKFNTINVNNMKAMFNSCYELEYLDLSNFDTSETSNMAFMFHSCNKLKYLNISKFSINDTTKEMFSFEQKDKCEFIANNQYFIIQFNSLI